MMRRFFTNRLNTFLDATYIIPPRVGPLSLRLRPPKPRAEQLYFIGATNVPIDRLDPALIRPGRMGRHIWFRTPTADDRKDISTSIWVRSTTIRTSTATRAGMSSRGLPMAARRR